MGTQTTEIFEALRESETRFRALVTAGNYSMYRMSPDWRVMYELDSETLANTTDPIEGWVDKYIPEEDRSIVSSAIEDAIRTKSLFELEHKVRLADGSIGWVLSRAIPILDEDGEILEWFGTGKDINARHKAEAERKRAEAVLRESEQRYHALFAASPVPSLVFAPNPPDFTITAANDAYFAATYTSREQIVGRKVFDVFPDDQTREGAGGPEALKGSLGRVLASRQPDALPRTRYDIVRPDGTFEPRWWLAISAPVLDADGQVSAIIHQSTNETELHFAEVAKRENQERQAFFLSLSDALRALDEPGEITGTATRLVGKWLHASRAYYACWPPGEDYAEVAEDYATPGLVSLTGRYPIETFRSAYDRISRGHTSIIEDAAAETEMDAAERQYYLDRGVAAWICVPLVKRGLVQAAVCVVQDKARRWTANDVAIVEETAERCWAAIERAGVEAALRESEERLALAFRTLPVGMAIIDAKGEKVMANEVMSRFMPTGVVPSRDPEQKNRWRARDAEGEMVAPVDFPGARGLRGETVSPGLQMIFEDEDKVEIWTEVLSAPLRDAKGQINGALVVVIDVDRIKRSEESARASEERFRLFVDNVQEYALMQTDPAGDIISWNPGAERMFGYSSAEVLGQSFALVLTPEDHENSVFAKELEFVATGKRNEDARWMVRKDGSRFWARWITEPVYETNGQFRGLAKVMRDETDRRRADEVVRASLDEKEELLKEVHHGVKNNLQVIVSLLNMQGSQIEDERVLAHFQEARNRVLAISSIHEQLYRAESFAGILLTDYARRLVPGLVRFYGLESRVQVNVLGDGNRLELERAVPFGILLNELVSNACKHAFPEPSKGTLTIDVRPDGSDIELVVSDDGQGLPVGFDYRKATSLGLKLVHALARQLRGTVLVSSGPGTTVKVRFPVNETKVGM